MSLVQKNNIYTLSIPYLFKENEFDFFVHISKTNKYKFISSSDLDSLTKYDTPIGIVLFGNSRPFYKDDNICLLSLYDFNYYKTLYFNDDIVNMWGLHRYDVVHELINQGDNLLSTPIEYDIFENRINIPQYAWGTINYKKQGLTDAQLHLPLIRNLDGVDIENDVTTDFRDTLILNAYIDTIISKTAEHPLLNKKWRLPSSGELIYVNIFKDKINKMLGLCQFYTCVGDLIKDGIYFSQTLNNPSEVYCVDFRNNQLLTQDVKKKGFVRPVVKLNLKDYDID